MTSTKDTLEKLLSVNNMESLREDPAYRFKVERFPVTKDSVLEMRRLLAGNVHSLWAGTGYLEQFLSNVSCFNSSEVTLPCFAPYEVVDIHRHAQSAMQACDTILIKYGTLDRLMLISDYLLKGQQLITHTSFRFDVGGMLLNKNATFDLNKAQLKFPTCYSNWVKFTKV